ncbi:hypothetical protein [Streptomyces luteolus]|uniref:Uncharacterized protein n=1 Tax=Streptomyces luteolus TaxID=3043615 RepID=A0ABT6T8R2_9ACTN|nr:hypothetical protein [Streptomyces sp. B-S-A12]MDI3424264.1 hypothetical protein [Streptomyces sp. B-S-A12]
MTFLLEPSSLLAIGALLVAAALLLAGWFVRRGRSRASGMRAGTPAIKVAGLAAVGCTAYSADTSWRFAADYLDMGSTVERAFMFATAELALFATALMARQNLNGPARAPGVPGALVWVITGVQIIPAYAEFGPVGGTVRAFVGPVLAAMLWHLAMGIELRHRTPQAASRGLATVLVRQTRERLLARLGIADQDADAARLIRERALSDAVTLILRAGAMPDKKRGKWRERRLANRLHRALEQAEVDGDPRQDELLLRKLATRKQAVDLASISLPRRWQISAPHAAHGSGNNCPAVAPTDPLDPSATISGSPERSAPGTPRSHDQTHPAHEREPKDNRAPDNDARSASGTVPKPEQPAPAPRRTGRPPNASIEELLAIARPVVARVGDIDRDEIVKEIREVHGRKVANDRLQKVIELLEDEQDLLWDSVDEIDNDRD